MAPSGTIAPRASIPLCAHTKPVLDNTRQRPCRGARYGHCQATEDNVEITVKSSILGGSDAGPASHSLQSTGGQDVLNDRNSHHLMLEVAKKVFRANAKAQGVTFKEAVEARNLLPKEKTPIAPGMGRRAHGWAPGNGVERHRLHGPRRIR
ncbi:hypothetical protein LshimejAT787_1301400 [Lyophyllum shimeji]|uniref:Uncharacterized protein n=1 Tax=Lyophyllum shimeji TaxID=47721 RepID=A0A9P3UPW3_LYOSH|nr:hypothetical protein LshimejAT787_1301400 [Lyophyllum shimeji]